MIAKIGEMKKYLKDAVRAMIDNCVEQVRQIFTDPELIHLYIADGSMWDLGNVASPEEVMPALQHTLYAYLIPHARASSNAINLYRVSLASPSASKPLLIPSASPGQAIPYPRSPLYLDGKHTIRT